jgi:hypothetical protein
MPQDLVKRLIRAASTYIDARHSELGVALFLIPALAIMLMLTEAACMVARLCG